MAAETTLPASASRIGLPARASALVRDGQSGFVTSLVTLPICVSTGVLMYQPLGEAYLAKGAAVGISGAVVGGLVGAVARTSSFVPNVPSSAMALLMASFAATLLPALGGNLALTAAALPAAIALAGAWQVLIGLLGLSRIMKFTPYPVLAGFVTGLAVLTIIGQIPRLIGVATLAAALHSVATLSVPSPWLLAFGLALIALMVAVQRRLPRVPSLVVGLVVGMLGYHGAHLMAPDLELGPVVGRFSLDAAALGLHIDAATLHRLVTDPEVLKPLLLTSLTVAVLGTLDISFAMRFAQRLADVDTAPRRNVAGQGLSNLFSALAGGVAVTSSIGFATTIFNAGGRTRWAPATMSAVLLLGGLWAAPLIAAIPTVVLAAILVAISYQSWDRWCVALVRELWAAGDPVARARARRNMLIVAAVLAATVLATPIIGALAGVALSCLVFIAEMSRPIVRRELDCSRLSSKRVRSQSDRQLLAHHGVRTAVLDLDGVLFFGNADDLAARLRALETTNERVILSFARVSDIDVSGSSVLHQMAERCRQRGIELLTAGVDAKLADLVSAALGSDDPGACRQYADLDAALEAAEERILSAFGSMRGRDAALSLGETDLAGGLTEKDLATLRRHLSPFSSDTGTALCRTGEAADRLWLLTRGSVSVRVATGHGELRIAALGPGTSVGEMGLLDRRPRSADVVADEEVEGFVLPLDSFDILIRDEPLLGQSLLATIARQTAQRLRATSEELRLVGS